MIGALVVVTDETVPVEHRQIEPTLEGFQACLDGGWLEAVVTTKWVAYCDEEGKLKGLPVNVRATRMARWLGWQTTDVLCGPVVFVGPTDGDGNDTSVRTEVLSAAVSLGYVH